MSVTEEIVIGNKGGDYISILRGASYSAEGWRSAEVHIRCGGWHGSFRMSFFKGELEKFGEDLSALHRGLTGQVELKPFESNLTLHFSGHGKGHINIQGKAYSSLSVDTQLSFAFEIDQTYLKGVIDALLAERLHGKVPS
jgi:hypothetical protein